MTENQSGKQIAERQSIDSKYQWQLQAIYATDSDWQADFEQAKLLLDKAASFPGHLGDGVQIMLDFLNYQDQLGKILNKIYLYAALKKSQDNRVTSYQAMRDRAEGLLVAASAKLAFFEPELLAMDSNLIADYLQNPQIAVYQKYIDDIIRHRPHTLSPESEQLLAQTAEMASAFDNIYSMLADVDMQLPTIINEDGQRESLSHSNYISFLQSNNRQVRKGAFEGLYSTYAGFSNTIAATLSASIKKDDFYAKARNYDSSLAASLFSDNVPPAVYHNLIKTVHEFLPLYYRYLNLRKKMLKLDQLHMYDVYVPLLTDNKQKYSYEQACQLVLEAFKPLGDEYCTILAKGLNSGWVDVFENKGKDSGAFSSGVYGTPPYMLLNYQNNFHGLFTLAHEIGHSMHSYYTWQNQPFIYADYRIFVAEVASTVNENLLLDYMLAKAESKEEIFALLNHFLEEFRGTVFRQTMFAEFELEAHKLADSGQALTAEAMNDIYYNLNLNYFGDTVAVDQQIAYEWMRIPHFYRAFYVYKYATGFCAALALSMGLTDIDPIKAAQNQSRYLNFLSSGSSADPIDLLKGAGIDMSSPQPIANAMAIFEKMLNRMEELI